MFLLYGWFLMKFVLTCNISLVWWEKNFRSIHWRCSVKKGVLKYFAKLTAKRLYQSFFFNKVAGLRPAPLLKKRIWHRCFPVNFAKFLRIFFVQSTFGRLLLWTTASETTNTKCLELIKRRSKVQEKNMSCIRALNFGQWKTTYSGNYNWLWLALIMACLQIFQKLLNLPTILRVHSN